MYVYTFLVSGYSDDLQLEMVLLTKDAAWCASLCHTLDEMRQSSGFSDVVIRADDGHIFMAHSCILAAASPVLKTQLLLSQECLDIADISRFTWEVLLHFIYTGSLEILDTSEIERVLETAKVLELAGLRALCEDWLKDNRQEGCCVSETDSASNTVATGSHGR